MEQKKPWSLSVRVALIIIIFTAISSVLLGAEVYQRESAELLQHKYAELENTANMFNYKISKYLNQVAEICDSSDLNSMEKIEHINRLLHLPAKNLVRGTGIKLGYYLNSTGEYAVLISEENRYAPIIVPEPGLVSRLKILPGGVSTSYLFSTLHRQEVYHVSPIYWKGRVLGEVFASLPANAFTTQLASTFPWILQKVWPLLVLGFCVAFYVLKSSRFYNKQLIYSLEALEKAYLQYDGLPEIKENLPAELIQPYNKYRQLAQHSQELVRELSISFRMAAIGEMIMAMAHDIRNPLAVIKASAEIGKVTEDRRKQTAMLGNIIAAGDTIEIFLNRYLNLTRYPRDIKEEVKLQEIFNALLPVIKPMLSLKNIRLEVEAGGEEGELSIYGDRVALTQAFLNLCSNAVEATPESNLIKLNVYRDKQSVVITLADTGYGIPEEIQPQVFEHFFTTKGSKGVGLGLALVKRVVGNHGGTIWFESQIGKGTTFFVKLPLAGEG